MFKFILLVTIFGLAAAASLDSDVHAEVKALDNDISPEGVFHYGFQSSNGIEVSSAGDANSIQGSYKFLTPEGVTVVMQYVADADGFKPSGDLPTPPPTPEAILRSLAWNEAHPSEESSEYKPAPLLKNLGRAF